MRQQGEDLIRQRHQRDQDDQHGDDVQQQLQPLGGAARDGVHAAGVDGCDAHVAPGRFALGRDHQYGKDDGGRRADERGREDVAERIRHARADDAGVERHDGAGDAGHAGREDDEQFAARDAGQIRFDQQRRLDHADEYIGCRGQADRAADAQRLFQQPGHHAHDQRQHAPMEQQGGQGAHHQNDRQSLKGQHEAGAGAGFGIGQRAAAEIAEHHRRAGAGGPLQRQEAIVQRGKRGVYARQFQDGDRQRNL